MPDALPEGVASLLISKVGPDLRAQIAFERPDSAHQLVERRFCVKGLESFDREDERRMTGDAEELRFLVGRPIL